MILLHQEEVDLLKTVILFLASSPPPTLTSREMALADSLREVPLQALKTYIMHCFAAGMFCGLLAHSGAGFECV